MRHVSRREAEILLLSDISKVEKYLNSKNLHLSQNQFDALISFIFNVGVNNFENSTLLTTLQSSEFERWIYADGKVLKGLQKRRQHEKELFDSRFDCRVFCWTMHHANQRGCPIC